MPNVMTHFGVSVDARGIDIYANNRLITSLGGRRFAHGQVLRVGVGGGDEGPAYLGRLRIGAGGTPPTLAGNNTGPSWQVPVSSSATTGGATTGGATTAGATTVNAVPANPTTTATGMTTAAPVSAVPATTTATGSTTPAAPVATAPKAAEPVTTSTANNPVTASSAALDQGLLVGAGMSDITGPIGEVVMMGYADGKQKTGGLHTRLYARAFIFANPKTNKRVVWVNTELGMVFSSVKQGVIRKLSAKYGGLYTDENVMISATHTHSGPGGYSHYTLYNISIGGYVKQNYDAIVDGIAEAIDQAHSRLAPGGLTVMSGEVAESTMVNRSKIAFMLDPEALAIPAAPEIDRSMTQLKILSGGRAIGAITFHAVHNTSMPVTNHLVSADHKGYAAYLLEKQYGSVAPFQKYGDFVAAFPNGAEGDMSPNLNTSQGTVFTGPSSDPFESTRIIGQREFNAAFGLFNSTAYSAIGSEIDYRHKFVVMPGTPVPTSKFTNGAGLKTLCTGAYGISFAAGAEDGRTGGGLTEGIALASQFDKTALDVSRQAAIVLLGATMAAFGPMIAPFIGPTATMAEAFMTAASDQCQFPKPILLPTGFMHWSPEILPFQILRIGSLAIVGIPGEMNMQAGRRLEAAVLSAMGPLGIQRVLLTGLANEYSGYITTPEEYVSQQYEGASTIFGRLTFDAYVEAYRDLGIAMAAGKAATTAPPPGDLSAAQIQWAPEIDVDELPAGESFGQILFQPAATTARGSVVRTIYRSGNPRNDLRRNNTYVRIERDLGGGNWGLVAWDGTPDTRLYWLRSVAPIPTQNGPVGTACPSPDKCYWSTMDVLWFVPSDATPGRYRIRVFGAWKNGAGQLTQYEGTTSVFTIQ
jgi:neutral ceramidase